MGSSLARQFPVQNSLTSDKAIKIDNLAQFLQKSQSLETRHHDGYGQLHTIKYKNEILYVGQSKTALPPPKQALHWLIQPSKVLVVPYYTKLENIEISKLKKQNSTESQTSVLMFIKEVCEFLKDKEIGMSRNKIAFSQKWTIMG